MIAGARPSALVVAVPILALWVAAPLVAYWLSRPVPPRAPSSSAPRTGASCG